MLTLRQLLLIKLSWSYLSNRLGYFGEEFYRILFAQSPALRSLFKSDLDLQEQKFATMINYVVSKVQSLNSIDNELKDLGQRHREYGVTKQHYVLTKDSFLEALKNTLADDLDEETFQAWSVALDLIIEKIEP